LLDIHELGPASGRLTELPFQGTAEHHRSG
jgi:hypothetical protein